jgi:hypothetical protein
VSKNGYVSRSIDVNVPENQQTILQLTLAADPLSKTTEKLADQDNLTLFSLVTEVQKLIEKPQVWAEGVWFFQEKASKLETKFDALVDISGNIYYYDKDNFDNQLNSKGTVNVGYLSQPSSTSLSKAAETSWEKLAPKPAVAQIQILPTPTGSLNVREGPSQANKILTTVKPGEKYPLLKEQSGWYQIKVGNINGWVSSQYAKKV